MRDSAFEWRIKKLKNLEVILNIFEFYPGEKYRILIDLCS